MGDILRGAGGHLECEAPPAFGDGRVQGRRHREAFAGLGVSGISAGSETDQDHEAHEREVAEGGEGNSGDEGAESL